MRLFTFVALISLSPLLAKANSTFNFADHAFADTSRVLIVGGGTHHDFDRWFNRADSTLIASAGAEVSYTDDPAAVLPKLSSLDILYLSNNQPLPDEELREAIFDFVEAGNGLLLVHAGTWYNWEDWPEFNRELVGGGTRSHPPYGAFEVEVTDPDHPVMKGVPERFELSDELYRYEKDTEGSDIHVLATATEPDTDDEYPVAWTIEYGDGRIVCITLGHDGQAHNHQGYINMLQNSIEWLDAD
ncbi:MAG: ThuA domain-containing protein [Balneolaceae bacterium]